MNQQSKDVFFDRYALRDSQGNLLEDDYCQLAKRLTYKFSVDEDDHTDYLEMFRSFDFIPGGRILNDGGSDTTLFNCFVIPIEALSKEHGADSRRAIMDTTSNLIEIAARGGGVGINWSTLRPKSSYIKGVNGKSSGAIAWMRGVDSMADQIRQGGTRTAALMWMLNDWHPDILEFISLTERFKRANFSVGISDRFMCSVEDDKLWHTEFPDTTDKDYDSKWDGDLDEWICNSHDTEMHASLPARHMFNRIALTASQIGSPGMVFLDTCQKMSNTWYLDRIVGTNPCGEQPLPPNGSCNLGSINLNQMWDDDCCEIDLWKLGETVETAVRFMDRVTDLSKDILKSIGDYQRGTRRIGIGTMGLADVLIKAEIRYGSIECFKFIDEVYSTIMTEAYRASCNLAVEFGEAPFLDRDKFLKGGFIKTLPAHIRSSIRNVGIRNLALLSQAPTGSTGILAGASSGIEPIFSKEYIRTDATGTHKVVHPAFKDGTDEDYLVTAHDISFEEHIAVQAAIQKYMDSAVSKTINMSACATPIEIGQAYMLAWKSGCKGITVFKDESFDGVCKVCDAGL